jgi:hypothetical protein
MGLFPFGHASAAAGHLRWCNAMSGCDMKTALGKPDGSDPHAAQKKTAPSLSSETARF